MVSEGKGRLFKRTDGKTLLYLPKDVAEDSMFPFKGSESIFLKSTFTIGQRKLTFTPREEITHKTVRGKTISDVARLFERTDSKFLIYLSVDFCEDSQFPFREKSHPMKVSFTPNGEKALIVEEWEEPVSEEND